GGGADGRGRGRGGPRRPGPQPRRRPGRPARGAGPARPSPVDVHNPEGVRLQKLLASAGWGSRRSCERLITDGRVEVDGQVVTELGIRVDPATQVVRVDGTRAVLDGTRVYLAFNKPLGVVSTMSDDRGRPSIGDYLKD